MLYSCGTPGSVQYSIRATSLLWATIPSVRRNPAASSKSFPGVRIVTDSEVVSRWPLVPLSTRISIGSSAATRSVSFDVFPPRVFHTSKRVVGPGRFTPSPAERSPVQSARGRCSPASRIGDRRCRGESDVPLGPVDPDVSWADPGEFDVAPVRTHVGLDEDILP